MLRSIKLRVSDRLQANKSGKVSISEPHEGEGVPPCSHQKTLRICTKPVGGPGRGWGVRTPRPATPQFMHLNAHRGYYIRYHRSSLNYYLLRYDRRLRFDLETALGLTAKCSATTIRRTYYTDQGD